MRSVWKAPATASFAVFIAPASVASLGDLIQRVRVAGDDAPSGEQVVGDRAHGGPSTVGRNRSRLSWLRWPRRASATHVSRTSSARSTTESMPWSPCAAAAFMASARHRTTRSPSSKDIAPANTSAVYSPRLSPAAREHEATVSGDSALSFSTAARPATKMRAARTPCRRVSPSGRSRRHPAGRTPESRSPCRTSNARKGARRRRTPACPPSASPAPGTGKATAEDAASAAGARRRRRRRRRRRVLLLGHGQRADGKRVAGLLRALVPRGDLGGDRRVLRGFALTLPLALLGGVLGVAPPLGVVGSWSLGRAVHRLGPVVVQRPLSPRCPRAVWASWARSRISPRENAARRASGRP